MPKLKDPVAQRKSILRAEYERNKELYGFQRDEEIATKLRMSRQTLQEKLRGKKEFKFGEVLMLWDVLHFDQDQRMRCIK